MAVLGALCADAQELNLAEAVGLAISQHPQMRAAQAKIDRERGEVFQAGRKPNPVIGYSAAEVGQEGRAGQQGLYLSQRVRRGNKIPLDVEVQRWDVAVARAEKDLMLCLVEAHVSHKFIAAAAAQRRLDLLMELQGRLDTAVERTETLVAAGFLKRPALLSMQLSARRNEVASRQQQQRSDAALWELGTAMGVHAAPAAVATDLLDIPSQAGNPETLWEDICRRSPELARARAMHQRSLWVVRRADVEPIPDLQTQFTFQHDNATDYPVAGVQVGVRVPVHDRYRGARAAARSNTRRTHELIHAFELRLKTRLAEVLRSHDAARQQLEASRTQLRDLVAENVEVTENAYDNKAATAAEVLAAHRARIEVELADLDAKRDLALAVVALHTCLATPIDTAEMIILEPN